MVKFILSDEAKLRNIHRNFPLHSLTRGTVNSSESDDVHRSLASAPPMLALSRQIRFVGLNLFICYIDGPIARIALFGLDDLLYTPPVPKLVLQTAPILFIFERAWTITACFFNRCA